MSNRLATVYPATIPPGATPTEIRQELIRITQEKKYKQDDWWGFFQIGQRQIFESLYSDLPDEDWTKPEALRLMEETFVIRAAQKWATPETKWILTGGWTSNRPDIVRRLRAICKKNFVKKGGLGKQGGDMTGSISENMESVSPSPFEAGSAAATRHPPGVNDSPSILEQKEGKAGEVGIDAEGSRSMCRGWWDVVGK